MKNNNSHNAVPATTAMMMMTMTTSSKNKSFEQKHDMYGLCLHNIRQMFI